MSESNAPLIQVRELCRTFEVGDTTVHALDHVTLDITAGELIAVMGPSGSGKSTLMNILGCLDRPDSGAYTLLGNQVSELDDDELSNIRNRHIGFIFQSFHLLPRLSALENVLVPLRFSRNGAQSWVDRAPELLERVGLSDRLHHRPNQLSGGQRQRVAIARALISNPGILLADEPTGNLDSRTSASILELFKELNEEGQTIMIVTHEVDVSRHANRIITMRDGQVEYIENTT